MLGFYSQRTERDTLLTRLLYERANNRAFILNGLSHSLPLWRNVMSLAKWSLYVHRTSYDLLLQFPLFMQSKMEQRFQNEYCWPAKLLWETVLGSNFHQRCKCFGRERVKPDILLSRLPRGRSDKKAHLLLRRLSLAIVFRKVRELPFFPAPDAIHHAFACCRVWLNEPSVSGSACV